MKTLLVIILLALSKFMTAQSWCDDIIKNRAYYSIKRAVDVNTDRVDSLKSPDSLVVTYYTKKGIVIKMEKHQFRGNSCIYNQSIIYFNSNNLPGFIEHFEQPCYTSEEKAIDSNRFEKLTFWYERIIYDSEKRMSERVVWYPTIKARRFMYSYDKDGKMIRKSWRIKQDEFWN
jgi:hypothetical protein